MAPGAITTALGSESPEESFIFYSTFIPEFIQIRQAWKHWKIMA
jgi:hypothetical protein